MRKKLLITAAAIILSAGSITGGTMAVYSAATHTDKTISTSSIGVSLNIADDGGNVADSGKITSQRVVQKVSAQNTGGKPQYVRVKVDKQWLDSDSQTVVTQRNGEELNTVYIGISYVNTDDWIYAESTDDNGGNAGYLYYKDVVYPGDSTSDFMDAYTILYGVNENTNAYSDLSVKVDYNADAIQTVAARAAMLYEWGVVADIDEHGRLTAVRQPDMNSSYEVTDDITKVISKDNQDVSDGYVAADVKSDEDTVIMLDSSATHFSVVEKDISFINMEPGETREGMVRLFNNSDKIMNFYINSTLLDNIAEEGAGTGVYNIKIYKQGEGDNDYSLLYDGMIGSGNNDILVSDQLLATLSGGESAGIKIIVTLDGESMDNSYMNKQGKIRLNVSAVQSGEPSTTVKTVKTGDSTMVMLYGTLAIIAGVACIGTITGLYARKRAKDNTISKKS